MFASDHVAHVARCAAVLAGLLMCGAACAEQNPVIIKEIVYLGAKHASSEKLSTAAQLHAGMPIEPSIGKEACQRIIRYYNENGRPFATCELVEGDKGDDSRVVFNITEGPKARVNGVEFRGNHFVSDGRLATLIRSQAHTLTFNLHTADADARRLEEYYRSFGFTNVRVTHELQMILDFSKVVLVFHIEEGERTSPTEPDQTKPRHLEVNANHAYKDTISAMNEAPNGSMMLGVGVNANAGIAGSLVVNERNFDLLPAPSTLDDLLSGRLFARAASQR